MDKSLAIKIVNQHIGASILNTSNTNYSKINDKKDVWWLNVPPVRFSGDLHLILLNETGFNWIKIPAGKFSDLEKIFKIRKDKNLVDLEISSAKGNYYMRDVKSGGTSFNFKPFLEYVFNLNN